jgi:hypothetical protein
MISRITISVVNGDGFLLLQLLDSSRHLFSEFSLLNYCISVLISYMTFNHAIHGNRSFTYLYIVDADKSSNCEYCFKRTSQIIW